jgi:hypothetical protein
MPHVMTKVKNPCRRFGSGFSTCCYCGNVYTKLGISRHWDRCKAKPPVQMHLNFPLSKR